MTTIVEKPNNTQHGKGNDSKDYDKGQIRLRREIGLVEAVALMVGSIVGSGIFISPNGILTAVGSPGMSLVIWILCGVIATSGAMTLMELQLAMPSSGGYYTYFYEVLGPVPAFLNLWMQVFIFGPSSYAILGLAIAKYVTGAVFSELDFPAPEAAIRLIAALCIWLFLFLNCYDVRITAKLQNIFFLAKILPLMVVIVAGIYHGLIVDEKKVSNLYSFNETNFDPGKIVLALYYGGFTYGGWDSLSVITEELKNPFRNMPLAVYISIPLVTSTYVLTNAAYLMVLSKSEFLASGAIGVTFIEKLFGNYGWLMSVFVSISILGVLSINIMTSSRQVFVGARNRQFLNVMGYIKASRMTPVPAILFLGCLSSGYLMTSDIFLLIDYTSYMLNFNNLGILVVFFYLRWKQPELERPVKVSIIHPLLFSCSTLVLLICPIYSRPVQVGVGITIGLCGLPMYYVFFHKNGKPRKSISLDKISGKLTHFVQKLFICLPED